MNDILLTQDMDLDIVNGDFRVDDSHNQQMHLLVATSKGDWKKHPYIGVGVEQFLEDEDEANLFAEIRAQFKLDGLTAKLVKSNNGELLINAE